MAPSRSPTADTNAVARLSRSVHSALVLLRRASLPLHKRTTRRRQRPGGQLALPGVKLRETPREVVAGLSLPEGVVYRFDSGRVAGDSDAVLGIQDPGSMPMG